MQVKEISFCEEGVIDEPEFSDVDALPGIDAYDLEKETDEKKTYISFFQIIIQYNFSSPLIGRTVNTENRIPRQQFLFNLIDLPPPSILLSSEK